MLKQLLLIAIFFPSAAATAAEDFELEEQEIEFDVTEIVPEKNQTGRDSLFSTQRVSLAYQLGSEIKKQPAIRAHQLHLRYRWEKLLNPSLYAKIDAKLITLGPKDKTLADNKKIGLDWRANNISLQWSYAKFATTVGFQSIVLGELDTLPLNDLLTPWDYSQQAFTNPEDARIGQLTIDAQWFVKKNRSLRLIFIPLPDVNRYPENGLTELFTLFENMSIDETFPYNDRAWEGIITAKQSFDSTDIKLMAGRLHTNNPVFKLLSINEIKATYPSYETLGASINLNNKNFLWKIEGNFQHNLPQSGSTLEFSDKLSIGGGFDYDANGLYQLTFETSYSKLLTPPTFQLGQSSSTSQSALRISKKLVNDLINLVYFVSFDWKYRDQIHSAYASYKITDRWLVSGSLSIFDIPNENSPMKIADGWDQFTLTIIKDI